VPSSSEISTSLKEWLETNLMSFLTSLPLDSDNAAWEMPVVEDYCLVVAVKDYRDGGTGVFSISELDAAPYRIRGLLQQAME